MRNFIRTILELNRNYQVFVSNDSSAWQRILSQSDIKEILGSEDSKDFDLLILYPNGQILIETNEKIELPSSARYIEISKATHSEPKVIELATLQKSQGILEIKKMKSPFCDYDSRYYLTQIINTSNKNLQVVKFAGFKKSTGLSKLFSARESYKIYTVHDHWYDDEEFVAWYGLEGKWLKPNQMVTDPFNYGSGSGPWVYFCVDEDGNEHYCSDL